MAEPDIRVEWIGDERNPVVVIDNFVAEPHATCAFARTLDYAVLPNHYYPGVRAEPPEGRNNYGDATFGTISQCLKDYFGCRQQAQVFRTLFSLATTSPHNLEDIQRLPHHDTVFENRYAAVHYLCEPKFGGTAFFRHRSTGYETITEDRYDEYMGKLKPEIAEHGLGAPAYITSDTPIFDHLATFEPAFNRAILFRGHTLHSGAISNNLALPDDPNAGRLSVVSFIVAE